MAGDLFHFSLELKVNLNDHGEVRGEIMLQIITEHLPVVLGAGLAISEVLALIPGIKGNSILQAVINGLQALLNKINGPKV
jgi:hypothetical protein